ncbi:ATP-dependent Clp protease adapter ClpS [Arcanobacterium sp. S3PF19]|uniref:ATP-dependent Clp protease adapter ClpS n=1 Tax=Arcanobacterium sp. S3PF19 TaxID=1219585 RepID=UPI00068BAB4D|nr:ATP-dependent Clp protease adapter ClpS [Arcanobacterium sp. S3PF19]
MCGTDDNSCPVKHVDPAAAQHSVPCTHAPVWQTVVHNDPINLMAYVQWIFESYFGMDTRVAREKMLQVHNNGRAVVASGGREQMEKHAQAMHCYGLWATIEPRAAESDRQR